MLIDFLTERYCFSESDPVISVILYILAATVALILRYWGQARCRAKHGKGSPFWRTLLQCGQATLWAIAFFAVTGCLKGPISTEDKTDDRNLNRKIFLAGIRYTGLGTVGSFLLYTVLQLLASLIGGTVWPILLLAAKALTGANLSLLWFSVLPLPGSDAEIYLRKKEFGPKGTAFRKNGTWPFFLFCVIGLLLACITVPLSDGRICSLSGIMTLFPVLLIGG